MSKQIRAGDKLVEIGLVNDGKVFKVVRLVDRKLIHLFSAPTQIQGVPAREFNYMIDPGPATEADPIEGQFKLVATGNAGKFVYETTWLFTWNPARAAFDVGAPTTEQHDASKCWACDASS